MIRSLVGPRLLNLRFLLGAHLAYRPGHFYSPICNPEELARRYNDPRKMVGGAAALPGIDLNETAQRALWSQWSDFLAEVPFADTAQAGLRYRYDNRNFGPGDAIVLYCMLRHFKPKRMIEIGSGFSSACALDTIERHLGNAVRCLFVEPFPALLRSLFKPADLERVEVMPCPVQDVSPACFETLDANDILFIDSTHVVKTGSDVVYELFEILPRLKPGVIVHFHDIHYPFEYPREWVIERNYSWNEVYTMRAFLMHNKTFEIVFFNDYFAHVADDLVARDAPAMVANPGGGLWLRRCA